MYDNKESLDFKGLRKTVLELQDELALMKRKYEDIIYNLDDDNFSSTIVKEKNNMKAEIKISAEKIETKVSEADLAGQLVNYSTISQTANEIQTAVVNVENSLSSQITQTANSISLRVNSIQADVASMDTALCEGDYTQDILNNYFTGIQITPNQIKMIDSPKYSIYSKDGLRFYDGSNDLQGWAIEPNGVYGGLLRYYFNNNERYRLGTNMSGSGYSTSDMTLKATSGGSAGRFVVDLTDSSYNEVKFVGLNTRDTYSPYIYANGQLLATQDWVTNNAVYAKFA